MSDNFVLAGPQRVFRGSISSVTTAFIKEHFGNDAFPEGYEGACCCITGQSIGDKAFRFVRSKGVRRANLLMCLRSCDDEQLTDFEKVSLPAGRLVTSLRSAVMHTARFLSGRPKSSAEEGFSQSRQELSTGVCA